MGHYKSDEEAAAPAPLPTSREDIARYQDELSRYISRFAQERQEAEYLLQSARNAQQAFQAQISEQTMKIAQLTMLVLTLTNKVEKLENGSGQAE